MASKLDVDEIAAKNGTDPVTLTKQSAAKAWVNFNGTGTIAARDSFNLSSLADNGTGDYTVNWSSALGNTNYSATTGVGMLNSTTEIASQLCVNGPYTTTSLRMAGGYVVSSSEGASDRSVVQIHIHGDLA